MFACLEKSSRMDDIHNFTAPYLLTSLENQTQPAFLLSWVTYQTLKRKQSEQVFHTRIISKQMIANAKPLLGALISKTIAQ